MRLSQVALLGCLAVASAISNAGISIGSHGIIVDDISVTENGIRVPTPKLGTYGSNSLNGSVNSNGSMACSPKNKNIAVTGVNRTVSISGACNSVSVNGTNLTVTIQQSARLSETGTNNEITIGRVDSIISRGTNATVKYHSGLSSKRPNAQATGVNGELQRY